MRVMKSCSIWAIVFCRTLGEVLAQTTPAPPATVPAYLATAVAGGGAGQAPSPDGVLARGARLAGVGRLAANGAGDIYFVNGLRIRRIDHETGLLSTAAGNGARADSGDGGTPTAASFLGIEGLAIDLQGAIYISDRAAGKVRVVSGNTIRSLISPPSPAGGAAQIVAPQGLFFDTSARLWLSALSGIFNFFPGRTAPDVAATRQGNFDFTDLAVDPAGTLYFVDRLGHRVYRIRSGARTTFAGTGQPGYNGDAIAASAAQLSFPSAVDVDAGGNVYICDSGNGRIRMVSPDGIIRTIAGGGRGAAGNQVDATSIQFTNPEDVVVNPDATLLVSDDGRITRLELLGSQSPLVSAGAFVDAISNLDRLSPGSLFSLYGRNLALRTEAAAATPLPAALAGATVQVNGQGVPLIYASPGQINGQVPYEASLGNATATVTVNGKVSTPASFLLLPATPSILPFGANHALVINPDGTLNSPSNPASAGVAVVVYLVGLGAVDPLVPTGEAALPEPLSVPVLPSRVLVNDVEAHSLFVGLTPGFVGLGQANFLVPTLRTGEYQLAISIGDQKSSALSISVRGSAF